MSKNPIISVIITNYNYADYIGQAIDSVLNQTYKNVELIVIDDGSTDGSDLVVKAYIEKNPSIIYITQRNKGVVYTRNRGMEIAKGEYLCCLDADDYFDADYIEKQYECIIEYKADVVYPNWNLVGDINQKIDFQEFNFVEYQKQHIHIKPESLIRASAIKHKNGKLKLGYIPETKERANDWAYFISLAASGLKFKLAKNNYINYRIKSGSMGSHLTKYEDIKIFYQYLVMLRKRYGEKIIDAIDLPIDVIKQQDEQAKEKEAIIHSKDEEINRAIEDFNKKNDSLEQIVSDMQNSVSWNITKPLRYANKILNIKK